MNVGEKVRKMFSEARRIIVLTRKPKKSEFNETIKVTGAGILIMGFIGFVVLLLSRIL
ncbi:MAG: protein translocase SEC61 complex subunit gamma [Candidatus Altiarchaeales archaeon]|nr:protein translocase SEC61 complex subunit gamma [Candidatus Altiarchaeales archaeon]